MIVERKNAERDWSIYELRKVQGLTLEETGDRFGLSRERVRQIVARCGRMLERKVAREEELKSAPPGSFLLAETSRQFNLALRLLYGENWKLVLVTDFLKQHSQCDLLILLKFRKKLFDQACNAMSRVVGDDIMERWRNGKEL